MKILLLTQIYPEPDDMDGYVPTKTVEYFAHSWAKMGHEVIVIHCQSKFPIAYYLIPKVITNQVLKNSYALIPSFTSRKKLKREDNGVLVYRLPMKKWIPSAPFSEHVMNLQISRIMEICNKVGFVPELVAGHFANPCMELTAKLGMNYGAKTSFVFHNDCTQHNIEKYHLDRYVKDIAAIGTRSSHEADKTAKALKLKRLPFICYSGVPDEIVESAEKNCSKQSGKQIKLLYAGGLVKNKHVDSIMNAISKLNMDERERLSLTIVGSGPQDQELRDLATTILKDVSVRFTGRLPRNIVADEMGKANVFIMISENETFGMVYLEAMLQGCIVVASRGGGFDGIIKNGENGFLCPPGDADTLAKILREIILTDIEGKNNLGQAAINTATSFSESMVAKRYLEEILARQ